MDKSTLNDVIETEKEIQACIEREKAKAAEWLQSVKRVCGEEYAREETKAAEALREAEKLAEREARDRMVQNEQEAAAWSAGLEHIDPSFLAELADRYVKRILPTR